MRTAVHIRHLSPGVARVLHVGAASYLLVGHADGVHAWRNRCPHMGLELDWREHRLLTDRCTYLRCGVHGALFRVHDGICVRGPCAGESLAAVEISTSRGFICFDG